MFKQLKFDLPPVDAAQEQFESASAILRQRRLSAVAVSSGTAILSRLVPLPPSQGRLDFSVE
jgi:hypothetical protein